jgi:hypothetical protein
MNIDFEFSAWLLLVAEKNIFLVNTKRSTATDGTYPNWYRFVEVVL